MNIDWNSEEGKRAMARRNRLLRLIDRSAPEGSVRVTTPLVRDEHGEVVLAVTHWERPGREKLALIPTFRATHPRPGSTPD
jgi:hypothetical protein